ncbi:MAG: tetraacyldisaccharide 4'-kinase [Motiliproteus sp.]
MAGWLERAWYGNKSPLAPLRPVEWLYMRIARQRRVDHASGDRPVYRAPVPVVVVGNISVGGVGKTPFVLWLLALLRSQGYRPGIISRGYGAKAPCYPFDVGPGSAAAEVGDEPLMLVRRSGCPLVIDPVRGRAAAHLLKLHDCDIIISDDGLQHYALARDLEVAIIDAQRGLGNRRCLPVGPLREPPSRLVEVDYVVVNGEAPSAGVDGFEVAASHRMLLQPGVLRSLDGSEADLPPQRVHAVAGIGNPQRFFATLTQLGYEVVPHPFPDHHTFRAQDLGFGDSLPLLMTEKDAVKCRAFASHNRYYLPVDAVLSQAFADDLLGRINRLVETYKDFRKADG